MDIPKLLSLLVSKQLYFTRLDSFSDPWEGVWPQPVLDAIDPNSFLKEITPISKKFFFVSCWHVSDHESAAMWDLYGEKGGVAIKTTCRELKKSLMSNDYYMSDVEYVDYTSHVLSNINLFDTVKLKRKSFSHEKEMRVVICDMQNSTSNENMAIVDFDNCKKISVDLSCLISEIYVSPRSPSWLVTVLEDLLIKYELPTKKVIRSSLYDPLVY